MSKRKGLRQSHRDEAIASVARYTPPISFNHRAPQPRCKSCSKKKPSADIIIDEPDPTRMTYWVRIKKDTYCPECGYKKRKKQ